MRAGCQRVMAKFDMGTTKLSGRSAMRAFSWPSTL